MPQGIHITSAVCYKSCVFANEHNGTHKSMDQGATATFKASYLCQRFAYAFDVVNLAKHSQRFGKIFTC